MRESHGFLACAHDLVGVAAPPMHTAVAPSAIWIRRSAPRTSRRSLVGVDAPGNRQPDLYTPDVAQFSSNNAWMQNFEDGNQNNNNKNNRIRCRAVRK